MGRRMRRGTIGSARRDAGVALVAALFVLATLIVITATSLLIGSTNVLATRNFRGAVRAHFVAESGILDALQTFNAPGVVNFQNDVVGLWGTSYGTAARSFDPLPGFTYSVTAAALSADAGRFIATATGSEGARNVVVATLSRSVLPLTAPGAVYLATNLPTDSSFIGNAFLVDGNDHNYTGGLGSAPPVPGIATRSDTNTQEAVSSLNGQQKSNVQGLGYLPGSPPVPSIGTFPAAPSIAQMNQFIDDLLARPGVVTNDSDKINGNMTYGTLTPPPGPQITHFSNASGVTLKANGGVTGVGILIVEGDLTVQGNLNFKGLVLVRGRTSVQNDPSQTQITGNATVYGSLWTQDFNFVVGGSAQVLYSAQALQLANQAGGGATLPAPLIVNTLVDCAELPAGTGGCP